MSAPEKGILFAIKLFARLAPAGAALALAASAAGYPVLRLSLPKIEGEIRLVGLGAPVEVLRDRYGIPHITWD